MGHKADFRAQLTTASRFVVTIFASNCRSKRLMIYVLFVVREVTLFVKTRTHAQ